MDDEDDCFECTFPVVQSVTDGLLAQGHDEISVAMALCQVLKNLSAEHDIDVLLMLEDFCEEEPSVVN